MEKKEITIDVIIPVYNPGEFLEESLRSCLFQSYKGNYRLILIDDGSTEEILPIVEKIKKSSNKKNIEIIFIALQKNHGVAYARNVGIRGSNSELIFFHDADDFMKVHRIERSIEEFQNNHGAVMVCSNFRWIIEGKEATTCFSSPPEIYYETMLIHFPINASTVAIKRSILEVTGVFNEGYLVGEDYDLWIRIAKYFPNQIAYIHEELAYYNWCATDSSLTKKYRKSEVGEKIFAEISKKYGIY
jgi:glycosyltransferase involved in cell wall biosynthesis